MPATNKTSTRTKVALWLLIGPTALLVVTFITYAFVNFLLSSGNPFNSAVASDGDLVLNTIINIILFILGSISVMTWLPGLITGIVLLATAPPKK